MRFTAAELLSRASEVSETPQSVRNIDSGDQSFPHVNADGLTVLNISRDASGATITTIDPMSGSLESGKAYFPLSHEPPCGAGSYEIENHSRPLKKTHQQQTSATKRNSSSSYPLSPTLTLIRPPYEIKNHAHHLAPLSQPHEELKEEPKTAVTERGERGAAREAEEELLGDNASRFVMDMKEAGMVVHRYFGKFHYVGPAVSTGCLQDVLSATRVRCQYDTLGKRGYVVYPVLHQ